MLTEVHGQARVVPRSRRPIGLVLAALLLLAGCAVAPAPAGTATQLGTERTEFRVTVVEVVDGDTVEVRFGDGEVADVRLLGVDTPEVHTEVDPAEWEGIPDSEAGRAHLETWGGKASTFVRNRLDRGETVRLVVDDQADRRGSYGRLLVYLFDDGSLLNRRLLELGYARLYESSFSKREAFAAAEQSAQAADAGVWGFGAATPSPRPSSTALAVVTIHADAEGNDHDNLKDEYVAFENTGNESLDLSGWRVEDAAGHAYRFPAGFTLEPAAKVVLRTGPGTDTNSTLYWGADGAVWNNGGDTVQVYDANGTLVLERTYD